ALQLQFRNSPNGGYEIVPESFPLVARKWELTNTRYLRGPAGFLDEMNQAMDPAQNRFRMVQRFDVLPKPGISIPYGMTQKQFAPYLQPDKLTAYPSDDGDYALFEFTGALP